MGGYTNLAEERLAIGLHLEAVTVDKADGRFSGDQRVAMINICHKVSMFVYYGEGPGQVGRRAKQELPICVRE